MRILFLTCSTGGGHNSAARALATEAAQRGHSYIIKDALDFLGYRRKSIISKGHVFAYKHMPKLYGKLYDKAGEASTKTVFRSMHRSMRRINRYLGKHNYDAVVCVHVFAAMMMTHVRKHYGLKQGLYLVATDYSYTPGSALTLPDMHFVPVGFKNAFAVHGIPIEKITEAGIPIKHEFFNKTTRKEAREKLGIDQKKVLVVLSAGSMGCGDMRSLAKMISTKLTNCMVAVLCGNNKRLFRQLSRYSQILPVGFTNDVPYYFKAANVIVTKAGGLTVTEAAISGTPMIIMNAVPGLETHNLEYFEHNRLARCAQTPQQVYPMVVQALADTEYSPFTKLKNKATKELFSNEASKTIIDTVEKDMA